MKHVLIILALLAPVSAFAQAPPTPCTTEQECLTHVLAEKLAQAVIQAAQAEAKLRVSPPVAQFIAPPEEAPLHPEHPGAPMTPSSP